jgi:hypothetical protein
MTPSIEVEIDEAGTIRPLDPNVKLPQGRAFLVLPDKEPFPLIPGHSFADWFTPEEDAAWAYMQTDNPEG